MFGTPVLLIMFNRPDLTQRVFDQIRKVKPQFLFIAADGPRPNVPGDIEKCAATREIVRQIDWNCELKTLFREHNRGCGYGPAEAITWFFDHAEHGIVLEDDCLPDQSFFFFCSELLLKYKDDERISMIGGMNPVGNWKFTRSSYLFSKIGFSWGWASWRRAWKYFDYTASVWREKDAMKRVETFLGHRSYYRHFVSEFDMYFQEVRDDVWDFQWLLSRLVMGGYTILPRENLISNIGYGKNATHTFDPNTSMANVPARSIGFPLRAPGSSHHFFFEWYVFERFVSMEKRSLMKKMALKTVKSLL